MAACLWAGAGVLAAREIAQLVNHNLAEARPWQILPHARLPCDDSNRPPNDTHGAARRNDSGQNMRKDQPFSDPNSRLKSSSQTTNKGTASTPIALDDHTYDVHAVGRQQAS
jgi:hypothetical protein